MKLGFDRARARDFNWLFTTHRIPARDGQHVQDQYFEFLDALGVPHEPVEWDLGPVAGTSARGSASSSRRFDRPVGRDRRRDEQAGEGLAARALGGGVSTRCASDFGLQPVLVGGRSPRELARRSR